MPRKYFLQPWLLKLSQLLEGGDNSSLAGSEAKEVFINTASAIVVSIRDLQASCNIIVSSLLH